MRLLAALLFAALFAVVTSRPHRGHHQHGHHERNHHHRHHTRRSAPQDKCASQCSGVQSAFRYASGRSYAYDYSADTEVKLPHGAKSTLVRQSATVTISILSPCELSLKLSDVALSGVSVGGWKDELESRPLRFSFDDGHIPEICPPAEEPAWALNIKRGILSAFQAGLLTSRTNALVYESDVSGMCPTSYERSQEGGAEVLKRTKELVECEGHHGNHSTLRGVPYHVKSKVQNTPLMKSRQECTHKIKQQILQSAECVETHEFAPVSVEEGIVATTIQKLKFTKEGTALPCCVDAPVGTRQSLVFDHGEYEAIVSGEAAGAARANLRDLCATSEANVRPQTPGLFTELVYNLRKMTAADVRVLQGEAKGMCTMSEAFFRDALPMCASDGCVAVMVDMLKSGSLRESNKAAWLSSLALVPKPSKAMVTSVTSLVDSLPPNGLLGVSSLVAGYCRRVSLNCVEESEVATFLEKLNGRLGAHCATSNAQQEDEMTMVLKAMGNVGRSSSGSSKVLACAAKKTNSMAIRVAALQALRRMPCSKELKDALVNMVEAESDDVELRLNAFLSLIQCPCEQSIAKIIDQLNKEPVNQVSSFIYSFLRAKQRSGSPSWAGLGRLLRKHSLHRRFARDPLRFSNFFETGSLIQRLNLGAHMDQGLIFVPKSSLPRQAFANLTVHLFGTSVNLIEIGGRFEGMDTALSQLFGPAGYFSNPNEFYEFGEQKKSENNRVRQFQDLWIKRHPKEKELHISSYLRVFGDELAAYNYRDPNVVESVKELMNTNNAIEALQKLSQFKYNQNLLFLDSVLTIPTVAGIPLRLAVNGTSSIGVEVDSKASMSELIRKGSMELMGHLKPSASLLIAASLTTDVGGQRSGARFVTTISTSTNFKGSLKLQDGKVLTSRLELPQDRMEIINVDSAFISVDGNVETVEAGMPGPRSDAAPFCTPGPLNRLTGLKVCGEMRLPGKVSPIPFLPITGPLRTSIVIEKDDPTLTAYEFKSEAESGKKFAMSFDTPGSSVDRNVRFEMEMKPGAELGAKLRYPGKELEASGKLDDNGKGEYKGTVALKMDGKEEYAAKATVTSVKTGRWEIKSEVDRPNNAPVKLEGELSMGAPRFAAIAKVDNLYAEPLEFKGIAEMKGSKVETELVLRSPSLHLNAGVELDRKGGKQAAFDYTGRLSHSRPGLDPSPHVAKLTGSYKAEQKGDEYKMEVSESWESNWYPDWDFTGSILSESKPDLIQNRINGAFGPAKDALELVQVTRITETDKYTTEVSGKCAKAGLDHKAVLVYQNRFPESFAASATIDTPRMKGIKAEMEMSNVGGKMVDLKSSASLEFEGRKVSLSHDLVQKAKGEYQSDATLEWAKGQKMAITSLITAKPKSESEYEYGMVSDVAVSGKTNRAYQIKKHVIAGPKDATYQGFLKAGDESVYDFKLTTEEVSKTRTQMSAKIHSDKAGVAYDVSGIREKKGNKMEAVVILKKDAKEYLKGEVVYPIAMGGQAQVEGGGSVSWALGTPEEGKLEARYQLDAPADNKREHTFTATVDMGAADPYEVALKIKKDAHHYHNSIKAQRGSAQILNLAVDAQHKAKPREARISVEVKSASPLPEKHAKLSISHSSNGYDFAASAAVENLLEGTKLDLDVDYKQVGGKMIKYKVGGGSKSRRLSADLEWDFVDISDYSSVTGGKTKLEGSWDDQKVSYASDWRRRDGTFTYTSDIVTPFKGLGTAKNEIELSRGKARLESNWGEAKRVLLELTGEGGSQEAKASARVQSSFKALSNLEARVKYAFKKDWEMEAGLEWGKNNELRFRHKSGPAKFDIGFISKVEKRDMEAKLMSETVGNTYKAEVLLKDAPSIYKISGEVDKAAKTGRFEVQTPSAELQSVTVSVKKEGDEWKVETDQNGQSGPAVTAGLKLEDGDHRVKLGVEGISSPFSVEYEGKFSDAKWRLKAELTRSDSVYGLHLNDEATSPKDRMVEVLLRCPSRQSRVKIIGHSDLPSAARLSVELTPNAADTREPTKISIEYAKDATTGNVLANARINDPSLTHDVVMTHKMEKEGCNSGVLCVVHVHGTIVYDADEAKKLQGKIILARREMGDVDGVKPVKMESSFEITHPATHLHLRMAGHRQTRACPRDGEEICAREGEAMLEFKNEAKEVKQYNVAYTLSPQSRSLKVGTPEMRWSVRSEGSRGDGERRLIISKDDQEMYVIAGRFSEGTILGEVRGSRNGEEEVLFHASARLVNKDLAQIRIWHTENGKRMEDGEVSIRLDRADLLNTRFYLRPGLDREIQFAARQAAEEAGSSSGNSDSIASGFRHALRAHHDFRSQVYGALRPLMDHWSSHKEAVSSDFGPVFEQISDVFMLYYELSKELSLALMDAVEQSLDEIISTVPSRSAQQAYYALKDWVADIPSTVKTVVGPFKEGMSSLGASLGELKDTFSRIKEAIVSSVDPAALTRELESVYEDVKEYPIVAELLRWLIDIQKDMPTMSEVQESMKAYYAKAGEGVETGKDSILSWFDRWEGTIVEYELGRALVAWLKELYKSAVYTVNAVAPEERIDDIIKWARDQFHTYREETMGVSAFLPRVVKRDPEAGELELEIPLPGQASSLAQLADGFHPDNLVAVKNRMTEDFGAVKDAIGSWVGSVPAPENEEELRALTDNVLHTLHGYQATQFAKSWPFKSHALLIGDEHYVTFDGRVFAFKADCDYLLAHDFVDERFTLHASYNKHGSALRLASLKLRAQGHEVTLSRGGAVRVDGAKQELPWQKMDDLSGNVLIQVLRYDNAIVLSTKDGIRIACDEYYHRCSVALDGHYHGKTGGLLGSNDNEPGNDFDGPDGIPAADVDALARAWHTGDAKCAKESSVATAEGGESEACREYFADRSSPFASCFRHVNPRPFLAMCEGAMSAVESDMVVCNISSAYTTTCRWSGIKLDMPAKCIRCDTPEGQLTEGENKEMGLSGATDVVFVVQEAGCNAPRKEDIVKVGSALTTGNRRYGVVGFGGAGVHAKPNFYTGANAVNFDAAGLAEAAATLSFQELELVESTVRKASAMEALKFVADHYPFRPASRKVVVLVSCGECPSGHVGFYELQTALLNNGINLHILADAPIQLQEGSADNLIGVDAASLYEKGGKVSAADRASLVSPHDSCTILAQETAGSVFDANSKEAVASLASVIESKSSFASECQVCECTVTCAAAGTPLTKCFPCQVPEPVSLSGRSGFFNIPYLDLKKPASPSRYRF